MLFKTYSKKHNNSMYTQNHNNFFFLPKYIRMSEKSINFDNKNMKKSDFV